MQPEWTLSLSVGCLHSFWTGEEKDVWVAAQADGQQPCLQSSYQRGEHPPYRSPCFESKIALPGAWLGMGQLLREPLSRASSSSWGWSVSESPDLSAVLGSWHLSPGPAVISEVDMGTLLAHLSHNATFSSAPSPWEFTRIPQDGPCP